MPTCINLLYVVNVSIVLNKLQKFLKAFESQVKVDQNRELACAVKAFRGRNLPLTYNDRACIYGSFKTSVISVVYIPIFLFQPDEMSRIATFR